MINLDGMGWIPLPFSRVLAIWKHVNEEERKKEKQNIEGREEEAKRQKKDTASFTYVLTPNKTNMNRIGAIS